jgi:hypothetical protein
MIIVVPSCLKDADGARTCSDQKERREKVMIIVVPSCLKDADGARTRSDQNWGDLPAGLFIIMVEPKLLTWPSTGLVTSIKFPFISSYESFLKWPNYLLVEILDAVFIELKGVSVEVF